MATEEARLIIRGENKTEAAFRQVRSSMGQLDGATQKLGRTLAGLGLGVSFGLVIRQTAAAVIEAEQSEARLAATLKATGNVTAFTATQLEEMNAQLVQMSTFDDEAIRNAQAQIVKFGNISGDVFSRALKLSADYASLLGTDLTNGAQQLGRALTAPEIGLTFLERNVGKFSDATRKAIKAASDLGDTTKAQALILDELDKRIGGTAEAMNTGLTKATKDLGKSWTDMLEALGRTPAVVGATGGGGVLGFFTKLFRATEDVTKNFDVIKRAFQGDFAARSAITDPELAAAQQREQGARDATAAAAEEAQQRDKNIKLAEKEKRIADESAVSRANSIAQFRSFAQAREDEFNSSADLERQLNAETKAIDDQTVKLAEQLAVRYRFSQEREDQFNDAGKLEEQLAKVDSRTRANEESARDLGLTFAVTFEDAIVEGEKLSDVLRALGRDIGKLFIRKTFTEPGAAAFTEFFKGLFSGAGSSASGDLGDYAHGTDFVPRTGLALVHQGERITPAGQNGGGGITIVQNLNFSANTPAASRDAVMAAAPILVEQAKRAVFEARARGQG
jgi:hypothetical protein